MSSDSGAAPMWPPMPTTPPTVGRGPRWRGRKGWLGLGVFVVVAGLVAGVLVWQGSRTSKPDSTPFDEALAELAAQPGIDYTSAVGSATVDMQVTYAGDVLGTVTVLGQKVSTMTVGGKTYVKMPDMRAGSGAKDPTGMAGKWVAGSSAATVAFQISMVAGKTLSALRRAAPLRQAISDKVAPKELPWAQTFRSGHRVPN